MDVIPWIFWGNAENDTTTIEDRLETMTIGAAYDKISEQWEKISEQWNNIVQEVSSFLKKLF